MNTDMLPYDYVRTRMALVFYDWLTHRIYELSTIPPIKDYSIPILHHSLLI